MSVAWQPHPGPQTDFCSRWEFEVLYGGAAGGGKTDCIIAEALRYVDKPSYHALILRRTFPELEDIIDRTRKLYSELGGVYRESVRRWSWPGGGKISFGHMEHDKDRFKYQGKEYQYIAFDEAGQFSQKQYEYLFSRCRSKDSSIPCRFRAATNPGGQGHHFLKNRFKIGLIAPGSTIHGEEGLTRVFIPAKLADNPTLINNDPDYIKRLMMLPVLERMRLLEGIWDAFEGQAFPELNPEVHGVDPFDIPIEWPRYRTMDWGYSTPFSVGWWAVDPNGIIFRYREWYGNKTEAESQNMGLRMSASEVARGILERERPERERGIHVKPGPADPDMWNPRWQNLGGKKMGIVGSSPAEDMGKEGVHFIQADNNRLLGRQSVHKRLELDTEGNPQVYIFKNCLDFWRTMPLLKEFENNPEEVENKGVEDHVYSEFRYFCMFRPTRPVEKPREDIGSFQAERRKLIKARQLASLRGIGLAEAYGKVK